jgi:predicted transcriptional regulator
VTIRILTADEKAAEIKRLYYQTTRETIQRDLDKAIDLVKSMASEDERERVAVYMDGLSQMRSEWRGTGKRKKGRGRG